MLIICTTAGKGAGVGPHTICAAVAVRATPKPTQHQPGTRQPLTPTPRPSADQDAAAHLPGSLLIVAAADGGGSEAADTGGKHDGGKKQRPLVRPARPSRGWRGRREPEPEPRRRKGALGHDGSCSSPRSRGAKRRPAVGRALRALPGVRESRSAPPPFCGG